MGLSNQILLLLYKNGKTIWRSKVSIICELSLSLITVLAVVAVLQVIPDSSKHKTYSFQPFDLHGDYNDLDEAVRNIHTIKKEWCLKEDHTAFTLGYSWSKNVDDTAALNLMQAVKNGYNSDGTNVLKMRDFPSLEDLKKKLNSDLNDTHEMMCGNYLGGIYFYDLDVGIERGKKPLLNYLIMFPQREGVYWHIREFWPVDGPYEESGDLNDIPDEPKYWSSGFLSLQWAIERTFIKSASEHDAKLQMYFNNLSSLKLHRMPTPKTQNSNIVAFMKQIHWFWSFTALGAMIHTAKDIVVEKEAGIKAFLLVMGLKPMAFYASHFLVGFIKAAVAIGGLSILLSTGFIYVSPSLFVFSSLIFAACSVISAVMLSTLIKRTAAVQITIIAGWICLGILANSLSIPLSRIGLCLIASLNPMAAFSFVLKQAGNFETRMTHLGWTNIFYESGHNFSVGLGLMMMIFDFSWMSFFVYYFDSVIPTDDSPREHPLFLLRFFGYKFGESQGQEGDVVDRSRESTLNLNVEDEHDSLDEADIQVRHLVKRWETNDVLAVDNISFNAYRGKVTVLLGHNGAGKSTTFSVISGVIKSTFGKVFIRGIDQNENLRLCQQLIGYCPQNNPLFDKLSVREHLWLYAKIKNDKLCGSNGLTRDIKDTLQDVGLNEKANTWAINLSGGQKRKLCVGMALIGHSPVVLLDEPTAGMDPFARNEISRLVSTIKHDSILDAMGDRIVIMTKGRIACNGSSDFLKSRYSTGYLLTIDLDNQTNFSEKRNQILRQIQRYSVNARIESDHNPPVFTMNLPIGDKKHYSAICESLENQQKELHIKSFGFSFNTLEQVFLKVEEGTTPERQIPYADADFSNGIGAISDAHDVDVIDRRGSGTVENSMTKAVQSALYLFKRRGDVQEIKNLGCLFFVQLCALIKRHFLNIYRNKIRNLLPLIFSFGSFFLIGLSPLLEEPEGATHSRSLALSKIESVTVPLQYPRAKDGLPYEFFTRIKSVVSSLPVRQVDISPTVDLQTALLNHSNDAPPLGIGMSVASNLSGSLNIYALFYGNAYHSPPLAVSLLTNSLFGNPDTVKLNFEVYDLPHTEDPFMHMAKAALTNIVISIAIITSFSTFTATCAMALVEDRSSKFKHQLFLTRLHPITYWFAVCLWNGVFFFLFCALLTLILSWFGWMEGCFRVCFQLWALYFWSSLPMIGCASFVFKTPQSAFTFLVTWFLILGFMIMMISTIIGTYIVGMSNFLAVFNFLQKIFAIFVPPYALAAGMLAVTAQCSLLGHFNVLDYFYGYCLLIGGFMFWVILGLCQSRWVARNLNVLTCQIQQQVYTRIYDIPSEEEEDQDVREERQRIDTAQLNGEFAVVLRDLCKYFGNFAAVKNLTFGINRQETFGLLGVNGAGKTTTFDILTGVKFANAGKACVFGRDVVKSPPIGYCPQFDAIPMEMTGREILILISCLNGHADAKRRVEIVLRAIGLEREADKETRYYSGGQRRRLSVGVTLLTRANLIMLDEPTAGIDPKTRRQIWDLLSAARSQGISILLTSHSMEECDELCTRIGFMNKGRLVAFGTPQHLKSRFGNSFMLNLIVENPSLEVGEILDGIVRDRFESRRTRDPLNSSILHWEIPKINKYGEQNKWSSLFQIVNELLEEYPVTNGISELSPGELKPMIKDFTLTQNSLHQVFMSFVNTESNDTIVNDNK